MSSLGLSPVTYLALVALGIVVYYYIRQRREYQRHLQGGSQPLDQQVFQEAKQAGHSTPKLPTFSAQEVEQRKPAKEIDQSTLIPRNLQHFPQFGNKGSLSTGFGSKSQPLGTTEKMFDGFRKSVPYDPVTRPSESSSVFAHLGKSETPTSYNLQTSPKNNLGFHRRVSLSQFPSVESKIQEPQYRQPLSLTQGKEEPFMIEEKQTNAKVSDPAAINKYGIDLDNEYKVFSQEFKQKEGKSFHEDGKKFDTPQRLGWGVSTLDRVGHSPESPFKIFESPFVEKESKKKLKSNEEDTSKTSKQQVGNFPKKDSLQSQETRGRETVQPSQTKKSKLSAKLERRSKTGQIFMDVNSDDEMNIEKEKGHENKSKRSGITSHSIDDIEKEATKDKYFKDNHLLGKTRGSEEKSLSQNIGSLSPRNVNARGSSKRKSTADIAYLSEFGGNLSMKRYIEKKTAQENPVKPIKTSVPSSHQRINIPNEKQIAKEPFVKTQEKPREEPKPFTSLIQNTGFINPSKKSTNGGSFLFAKEQKPLSEARSPSQKPTNLAKEDDKIIEEIKPKPEIQPNKLNVFTENKKEEAPSLFQTTNIANKTEPPKISNILGGSSIFAQPKPTESSTTSLLLSSKPEETKSISKASEQLAEKSQPPQKAETEKESESIESAVQQKSGGFDLFKTVRAGDAFPKPSDLMDKPKEAEKSSLNIQNEKPELEKKDDITKSTQENKLGLFNNLANGNKKTEDSTQPQGQDSKPEIKSMFGGSKPDSSGGLFTDLVRNNSASNLNKDNSQVGEPNKKTESSGAGLFANLPKPVHTSLSTQSPLFGAPSIKKEDSKGPNDSPTSNFFNKNKPEEPEKNASTNLSGGLFNSILSQQKNSNQEAVSSPTNDKASSSQPTSGLFGNSSAFSKSFVKNDGQQTKADTPMFGSLKQVEGEGNKPSGSLFPPGKQESGLFANSSQPTTIGGSGNGGLWGQNSLINSDKGSSGLFGKKEGGLFSNLGNTSNTEQKK